MKKILITGSDSYIGTSFESWLLQKPGSYHVDTVDMRNDSWKEKSFSGYDVIFHVAGIAHVSTDSKLEDLYYIVNRDLTIKVANKAKVEGVKQFIFMSSVIVYGDSGSIDRKRIITKETIPTPSNFYGRSKLQAEEGISPLNSNFFKVLILRPPMIYGKGSKGNYLKLAKLAKIVPVFPDINNQRSMIHIDNLCEFLKIAIDNEESGLFFPQNNEYVKTSELVKFIAEVHGKKIRLTKIFNPILRLLGRKVKMVNKVFGDLVYDKSMSEYRVNYCIRTLKESVLMTESRTL